MRLIICKVFHIQPGTDGGTERFFVTLSQAFHERGMKQQFAIRPHRVWRYKIENIGDIHEGQFLRRTPRGIFDVFRMHREIQRFRPDAIMAWRAPAARLIPRNFTGAKIVRLGDYPSHIRHFKGLDAVVCNNPSISRHIQSLGWLGPAPIISNFSMPLHGMPASRRSLDTPDNAFVVCGVGRLSKVKGFDILISAVAGLENIYLWLVGDGPEYEALNAQARHLGVINRVRFTGWHENPSEIVRAANLFVLPSRNEPLGNSLIEAWQAGIPSVATDTDGPNWFASDGRDSLIIPSDDIEALTHAIKRIKDDTELRATIVSGANKTLAEYFNQDRVINSYINLFKIYNT